MSKQNTVVVTLYDAEKNSSGKSGSKSITVKRDDPNDPRPLEERIKEIREKQKTKNAEFRKNKNNLSVNSQLKEVDPEIQSAYLMNNEPLPVDEKKSSVPIELKPRVTFPEPELTPFKLKLDPGTGNTTFLMGSSKQGKSTAMMHIYDEYYADENFISILWTNSPQIPLYKKPKLLRSNCWGKKAETIIKSERHINQKTKNKYKFLNMMDDLIEIKGSTLINDLVLTYRNSNISSIISLQYSNLFSKSSRANANNVVLFGFNTDEAIEVVIRSFLNGYLSGKLGIKSVPDQINWYKKMTADHKFIYVKPAGNHVSFHKLSI